MSRQEEHNKRYGVLGAVRILAPIVMKAAPVLFWCCILVSICHGLSWGIITVIQQNFFDNAVLLVQGKATLTAVFIALGLVGLIQVISQLLNGIGNYLPNVLQQKASGIMSLAVNQKMARLFPIDFENTSRLDDINKAEMGKDNAVWFVLIFGMIVVIYIPYFVFMGGYLYSLKPVLAVAILLTFIPTALAQLLRTRLFAQAEDSSAPARREFEYYENCMVSREYFKETRLLGAFGYFKQHYMDALTRLQELKNKATMRSNLFELAMKGLSALGYAAIVYLLFTALMKQEISVGAFAAVFNSIGMLFSLMEEMVNQHLAEMSKNMGTVENYLRFLDLEERRAFIDEAPQWGDISLEQVSFSYPGAERKALKDISLTLKRGETLAVVGENGSGKSTLIRLLTGLYQPCEGRVLHNGIDAAQLTNQALFQSTSAVFQKYQRYQMTLEENLVISDTGKAYSHEDLDALCTLSGLGTGEQAGDGTLELGSSFPEGYATMLSREFDGVDLSGGQWQRIAIARGFFRPYNLIILDEPTAAIDPYEETRIYNQFAEIAKDKSAVIVTHRLGSVKLADQIAVMKGGEMVQIGTHLELIGVAGEYKRLYEAQEQWYTEELAT